MEEKLLGLFGGGRFATEEHVRRRKARELQDAQAKLDGRISDLDKQVSALEQKLDAVDAAVKREMRAHGKITARARRFAAQRKNFSREHEIKAKMLMECEQQRSHLDTLALTQDYTSHMREMRDVQRSALGDPDELEDLAENIEEYQDDQEDLMETMRDHTDLMTRVLGGGVSLGANDDELAAELEELQLEELNDTFDNVPSAPQRRVAPSPKPEPERQPTYDALLDAM